MLSPALRTALPICFLLLSSLAAQPASDSVRRIESTVVDIRLRAGDPPLRLDLAQLMKAYNVPGLSVAVIENYRLAWAKSYGVLEPGSTKPVTTRTLFQAGSISKPVAAAGALALVEKGVLSLDEDVNRKLKSWKVPENEFTAVEKVTLRRLMSHTAGLTVHGFPGYRVGAAVPSTVQVLDGEKPANTAAVRVNFVPGAKARYSGGGITIEQLLMTDVTGKPFPALLQELVLHKIGMTNSSYEQPIPKDMAALTAGGAYADGKPVEGRWHLYPEMAAAGLWTTPADLSKFAIEIALSKLGRSNRVLSLGMTATMLTPVRERNALGFFIDPAIPGEFGHNGADEGFQALFTMNSETGNGIVIMANSDNGSTVADLLANRIRNEYGWPKGPATMNTFRTLMLLTKFADVRTALDRFSALRKSPSAEFPVEKGMLSGIGYSLLNAGNKEGAVLVFENFASEYPDSAEAFEGLGNALSEAGRKAEALGSYERALALDPRNADVAGRITKLKSAH